MSATPDLRTLDDYVDGKVVYNMNMPMGSLRGVMSASTTGDLLALMENFAAFVVEWPYEGDPSEVETWDDLGRREFNDLISAITTDMADLGEA